MSSGVPRRSGTILISGRRDELAWTRVEATVERALLDTEASPASRLGSRVEDSCFASKLTWPSTRWWTACRESKKPLRCLRDTAVETFSPETGQSACSEDMYSVLHCPMLVDYI